MIKVRAMVKQTGHFNQRHTPPPPTYNQSIYRSQTKYNIWTIDPEFVQAHITVVLN